MGRVAVVGLASADRGLIDRLLAAGHLLLTVGDPVSGIRVTDWGRHDAGYWRTSHPDSERRRAEAAYLAVIGRNEAQQWLARGARRRLHRPGRKPQVRSW